MIFLVYNGNGMMHGLTTIGPIIWNFVNGWKTVGGVILGDLGICIIGDATFGQLP